MELDPFEPLFEHARHGIGATATDANDLDPSALARLILQFKSQTVHGGSPYLKIRPSSPMDCRSRSTCVCNRAEYMASPATVAQAGSTSVSGQFMIPMGSPMRTWQSSTRSATSHMPCSCEA